MKDNNFCQCETPAPKYGQKSVICLMCDKPYRRDKNANDNTVSEIEQGRLGGCRACRMLAQGVKFRISPIHTCGINNLR